MKKFILFIISFFLATNICYSQSGWSSKYFNNVSTISKIIRRDSLNYLALCYYSKYYFKSSDAGNNWSSISDYSFDSVYNLFDGQFINSQTGWVIGENNQHYGAILKTSNGGINWIRQNTGLGNWICYCLFFLDQNTGWVGTTNGNTVGWLIKTTNGGINWTKQEFPSAYNISYVKFFDNNSGWIMGQYLVALTTNGGQNWQTKTINNIPPTYVHNRNMCALSINECWALIISANSALIYSNLLKTTDGGNNWTLMYRYTDSLNTNSHSFAYVNFINSSTGFLNGDFNFIVRSTNSGVNWSRINLLTVSGTYPIISSIMPINTNEIFAGGGYSHLGSYSPFNYILKSENTGLNWSMKSYRYHLKFSQVLFLDYNTGFVIADSGRIFRTTNNGNNWIIYTNGNYWFKQIAFANAYTGCIIADPTSYFNRARVLRTSNGGNNWFPVFTSEYISTYAVKFIDQQTCWVTCDSNRILKTTNAGLNWYITNMNDSLRYRFLDICFINNYTGWLLGEYNVGYPFGGGYIRNKIWKTTNKGNIWTIIYDTSQYYYNTTLNRVLNIQFIDDNNGIRRMWDPPKIQKSTNGGSNWFNLSTPNGITVYSLKYININTGWIAGYNNGGIVYKTTNGGGNWILQFSEYNKVVKSIYALNSDYAWFCGDYSSIYSTTNGGGMIIGIYNLNNETPQSHSLSQNYPNPFNPVTRIKYDILSYVKSEKSNVKIIVYDILGRDIETLVNESQKPGSYEVTWDGSRYASGVYFYRMITDDYMETKKMVLLK